MFFLQLKQLHNDWLLSNHSLRLSYVQLYVFAILYTSLYTKLHVTKLSNTNTRFANINGQSQNQEIKILKNLLEATKIKWDTRKLARLDQCIIRPIQLMHFLVSALFDYLQTMHFLTSTRLDLSIQCTTRLVHYQTFPINALPGQSII